MFTALRLITLPGRREAERDSVAAALRETATGLRGATSSWVAPVFREAVINAGHVVWRMTFDDEGAAQGVTLQEPWRERVAPLLEGAEVTTIGYRVTQSGTRPGGSGIWRALIFRVMPHGFPALAKDLEEGLLLLPKYIGAIRSWALSPISAVDGPKTFTHVWEQEFDSLGGLTGEYMDHPIHWGFVDAFFDAEYPQYIVDPHVIQVVGTIDGAILSVHEPSRREPHR